MQTALLTIPEFTSLDPSKEFHEFADVEILDTEPYGSEIKTTEFHPSNQSIVASIVDGKILLFNRTESKSQVIAEIAGKKLSGGIFSNVNQFVAIYENGIRSYDIR
jgi:EARP and GARP complex-interacting protein 1